MKKLLALLLCAVLLSLSLFACQEISDTSEDTSVSEKSEVSGEIVYTADIPEDLKFEGQQLIFLTAGVNQTANSEIVYNDYGPDAENMMIEVVNDALRERENIIEERLGVDIVEKYVFDGKRYNGEMLTYMRNDAAIGKISYHVAVPCLYDAATLAAEDLLVDLLSGEVPYLNMSQPWWNQSFNKEMTLNGSLYFTIGDIGLVNKDATPCIAFNKNLITEYSLENPYALVDNGTWTIDKVIEMSKTVRSDLNSDKVIDYRDQFGYGGQYDDMWYMFYGSGERLASVGEGDDWPTITAFNERSTRVVDKILELMQNKEYYVCANDYFGVTQWPSELVTAAFVEGRSIFNLSSVSTTESYRSMEDAYGLLPIPKYDEDQDRYYSMVNPWICNAFCIPANLDEDTYEMIGATLEVMGAFSKNNLAVAYYDIALVNMKTRDEDTIRMLDIIFASSGCDIGAIYKWGDMDLMLQELITKPAGSFASTFEAIKETAEADLEETINFYQKNN